MRTSMMRETTSANGARIDVEQTMLRSPPDVAFPHVGVLRPGEIHIGRCSRGMLSPAVEMDVLVDRDRSESVIVVWEMDAIVERSCTMVTTCAVTLGGVVGLFVF